MNRRRRPARCLVAFAPAVVAALLAAGCAIPGTSGGPGATLTAPQPTGPEVVSPIASAPTRPYRPTPAPAPTFAAYVVRPGDTLDTLATRFATTRDSLAYWNRARYPSLDPDSSTYRPGHIEIGWQLLYLPGEVVDPESLPPASAPPSAAAEPVGPYPTLPADGSAALVVHGPTGFDGVTLTFEYAGGPGEGPGGAEAIVQWLQANQVPATVFVDARAAADPTGQAVLARLAGAPAIRTGLLASAAAPAGLAAALVAADAPVAGVLGHTTAPWLRPVGGEASSAALRGRRVGRLEVGDLVGCRPRRRGRTRRRRADRDGHRGPGRVAFHGRRRRPPPARRPANPGGSAGPPGGPRRGRPPRRLARRAARPGGPVGPVHPGTPGTPPPTRPAGARP